MGKKLLDIYEAIRIDGDKTAQMRLAMKTGMSSQKAKDVADSLELFERFSFAYKEITGKDCPIVQGEEGDML